LYPCADYAFVGGSLVPIGGHNVLEPIAVGVPVFCGPYMHNSKAICEGLLAVGGIMKAPTATAVIEAMIMMHQHLLEREQQIQNASSLLLLHKGGVSRCLAVIYSLMNVGRC